MIWHWQRWVENRHNMHNLVSSTSVAEDLDIDGLSLLLQFIYLFLEIPGKLVYILYATRTEFPI